MVEVLGNDIRVRLLQRSRRLRRQRDAQLTAGERLAVARRLQELASLAGTADRETRTDEPPETWLKLIARLGRG